MRRTLDALYSISGGLAAMFICMICLLVCTQVVLNVIAKIGIFGLSPTIPSYADFAGYFLAASSFLALSYTLQKGGHIRVTLLTGVTGDRVRFGLEIFVLAICAATAIFAARYMAKLTMDSWEFGDVSSGIVAIPLFVPQAVMLLGLVIFAVALVDLLVQTIRARRPVIENASTE
ncbi:C4-dicarboxylate ABC transporter substrate-binding protein [Mesorhizobium sp. L-8-10]|uniref:TRAP transporter small permease n=1 Tax=unclassified Mesorhizobium TaxID=325217 RepID=UPI0019269F3C|nr:MULTISPECIES: TRAP transporter small permease subunit [unclassified Mesorhizobium]BCH21068.1 C4-dicarboxylate ABC transporter substrate-binding protein [Mesorhizobium sp. L-8-3]BCH28911.1 C4-dicarboxylate ABC transporter substrate-binding protein [Mesorhizobium sp. L-8-10]